MSTFPVPRKSRNRCPEMPPPLDAVGNDTSALYELDEWKGKICRKKGAEMPWFLTRRPLNISYHICGGHSMRTVCIISREITALQGLGNSRGPPKFPNDQNTQTSSWHETTRCLFSTLSGYQGSMIMSCRPGYYPLLRASAKFVPHAHKPQFSGHEVIACASDISASKYSCSRISMYRALSIS